MSGPDIGPDFGIVAALPIECLAVRSLVDDLRYTPVPDDRNHYHAGTLPSKDQTSPHPVVVALQTGDGTRNAAAICTDMAHSFPGLRIFVMCGIAAGVPAPGDPGRHVDLGDIVVATSIVDYRHVRRVAGAEVPRAEIGPPSSELVRADRELQVRAAAGDRPWSLDEKGAEPPFQRPLPATGAPRVHRAPVGSADLLLRDPGYRDALAAEHGIRAFEMEGSGVSVAAGLGDRGWFMVRGIADHGDTAKSDLWHPYASMVAAAYVRALLAECPPLREKSRKAAVGGFAAIVEALLTVPAMRDDYQRRGVLAQLPDHIRTSIPDSVLGRLHVVALVRTCEQFADGREALLGALRVALGESSPEYLRVQEAVQKHWLSG